MAVDPYAAIRTLQPVWTPEQYIESSGEGGGGQVIGGMYGLDLNALANTPFQSKYNSLVQLPDGSLLATFQRPGGHKHETFSVQYRQDPSTGQWAMDENTIQAQQEKSGARQFWRSVGEGALVVGAGYLGGSALSGMAGGGAGGTAAGLGEGSGAWLGGADAAAGGLSAAEAGAVGSTAGGTAGGGLGGGGFMDPTAFSGYGGNLSMANAGGGFGPGGFGASLGNIGGSAAPAATGGGMWQNLLIQAGSTLASSAIQSRAAGKAAGAQAAASQAAVDEQRRQFDELQRLLAPYVQAGTPALQQLQALAGTAGPEAQQAAIGQIEQSPFFQSSVRQGEEAMLQRASATGGLRGGNIQGALAQFRPAMLQNAIEQQYARLSGLTTLGQQSAARVGASGMQTGTNIGELLLRGGAAQAGGIIGQAAPWAQFANLPGQYAAFQTGRGVNVFGGTQPTTQPSTMPAGSGFQPPPNFQFGTGP